LWITTKSDLVVRDLDLLERVARRNMLSVNFTVTTLDRDLARGLEPAAPRPDLRLEALRQLSDRGIPCGVNCMPILPGLNDDEAGMTELARAAKSAGARWISGSVLFLKSPTREVFRRFLEREHPALTARYDAYYSQGSRAPREYQDEVRQRLEASRRAAGLSSKAPPYLPPDWESGRQLSLAL
jgi:DNA repair photolyase